jgi:hypothetical protein
MPDFGENFSVAGVQGHHAPFGLQTRRISWSVGLPDAAA